MVDRSIVLSDLDEMATQDALLSIVLNTFFSGQELGLGIGGWLIFVFRKKFLCFLLMNVYSSQVSNETKTGCFRVCFPGDFSYPVISYMLGVAPSPSQ